MTSSERLAVLGAYFSVFFGAGVWVPYFPLFLSHIGCDGWQIGVTIGMQPILRWSGALLWAYVADRWRIRHRVMVATAAGGMLFLVPLLFAPSFAALLATLAMVSLLHGTMIPMLDATVMDHLPRLGDNYGRLRLWGSVRFVAGSLLSAPLVHFISPAIVPVLLLLPALVIIPSFIRLPSEQHGHHQQFRSPWSLLNPSLSAFLATGFLLQASCGAFSGFFAIHAATLGFSDAVPGLTLGLAVAAEVILLAWGRPLLERFTPTQLLNVALAVTAARWAATAVAQNEILVIGLQLGHIFAFSVFHLAALRLLARLVPAENSTSGQTLYGLVCFGLGGSVGLSLAGALVDLLGTPMLFGVEALVTLLAVVPAMRLNRLAP